MTDIKKYILATSGLGILGALGFMVYQKTPSF